MTPEPLEEFYLRINTMLTKPFDWHEYSDAEKLENILDRMRMMQEAVNPTYREIRRRYRSADQDEHETAVENAVDMMCATHFQVLKIEYMEVRVFALKQRLTIKNVFIDILEKCLDDDAEAVLLGDNDGNVDGY